MKQILKHTPLDAFDGLNCSGGTAPIKLTKWQKFKAKFKRKPFDHWRILIGHHTDTTVAIHGSQSGYIACGLPLSKASEIVKRHNTSRR